MAALAALAASINLSHLVLFKNPLYSLLQAIPGGVLFTLLGTAHSLVAGPATVLFDRNTASAAGIRTQTAEFDPPTALFSSILRGLSAVLLLSATAGAKIPQVTMTQCLRMTLITVTVFFLVQGLYGGAAILPPQNGAQIISLQDLAILIGGCAALILCLQRLKLLAPEVACTLVVSSLLYGSGMIEGELPS